MTKSFHVWLFIKYAIFSLASATHPLLLHCHARKHIHSLSGQVERRQEKGVKEDGPK